MCVLLCSVHAARPRAHLECLGHGLHARHLDCPSCTRGVRVGPRQQAAATHPRMRERSHAAAVLGVGQQQQRVHADRPANTRAHTAHACIASAREAATFNARPLHASAVDPAYSSWRAHLGVLEERALVLLLTRDARIGAARERRDAVALAQQQAPSERVRGALVERPAGGKAASAAGAADGGQAASAAAAGVCVRASRAC